MIFVEFISFSMVEREDDHGPIITRRHFELQFCRLPFYHIVFYRIWNDTV